MAPRPVLILLGLILLVGYISAEHQDPDRDQMNCSEYVQAMKKMDEERPVMDREYADCDKYGNYEPKQCYAQWTRNGYCSCFHPITGKQFKDIEGIYSRDIESRAMSCHCAVHYADSATDRAKYCDVKTGDYKKVTCMGNTCRCAHRSGAQMMEYSLFTLDENSSTSNCNCARRLSDYQHARLIGLTYNCDHQGAYEPVQCTGSRCYCVDKDGRRVNKETVPIWKDLKC